MDQQPLEETVVELGRRLAQSERAIDELNSRLAQLTAELKEFRSLCSLKIPGDYDIDIRGRLTVKANDVRIESKSSLDLMSGAEIRQEAAHIVTTGDAMVQIQGGLVKIN